MNRDADEDADEDASAVRLTRPVISAAIEASGWRLLLDTVAASVPVSSLRQALEVAAAAVATCGADADEHLRVDIRPDRVELGLTSPAAYGPTARDTELAAALTATMHGLGRSLAPPTGARPVQRLEIAIDALNIPAIRPFWLAVLGYDPSPDEDDGGAGIVDPAHELPTVWFQQLDEPRPQRNRIHFDLAVPHDDAQRRITAALAAGGVLVNDAEARAFWTLADVEGNEVCICTWQDRD